MTLNFFTMFLGAVSPLSFVPILYAVCNDVELHYTYSLHAFDTLFRALQTID